MIRLLIFAILLSCNATNAAFGAETTFETLVDKQGHPLDDPRYDLIRKMHEQEERGLTAFRSEDYTRAYELLAEPASHGFKSAQHCLALMHINGHAVEQNVLVGVALLGLAAESGDWQLKKDFKAALKKIPKKYQQPVKDQTAYYIARYGMAAQGVSCEKAKQTGSNMSSMVCIKEPGEYQHYDWAP